MINERVSQAILVSGKSSAGKIESIKKLMWLLAYMGESVDSEERSVEQQVLEICNFLKHQATHSLVEFHPLISLFFCDLLSCFAVQSSFRSLWQVKIPRNNTSP